MLKTRSRIDALAAELAASATSQAEMAERLRAELQEALTGMREDVDAVRSAAKAEADALRDALAEARGQTDRLRDAQDEDRRLLSELRADLARLHDGVAERDGAHERLHLTVTKLEHRMAQQAEDLRGATAALLARMGSGARSTG